MNHINNKKVNMAGDKLTDRRGMTMAEMLVTVAIIIILCGVAFIAVVAYQRSLAQVQRDGYAKEIFIAAQNHLTMARGEGYLDITSNVTDENKESIYGKEDGTESEVYYFLVSDGKKSDGSPAFTDTNSSILDMMLPFGSIDETVRMGGSYVIRYQATEGKILDVFYCTTKGSPERFNYTLQDKDYDTIKSLRNNKAGRRTFVINGKKAVLGYYGGTEADELPTVSLKAPSIKLVNDETLYVEISGARDVGSTATDRKNANMKLIITGVDSGAKKAIDLTELVGSLEPASFSDPDRIKKGNTEGIYIYEIDDISKSNTHFADLGQDTDSTGKYFMAGEDIKVEAVVYSLSAFSNIEFSNGATENSLFESIADPENKPAGSDRKMTFVSKVRHLENLSKDVSNAGYDTKSNKGMTIISASQTENLKWSNFTSKTKGTEVFKYTVTGSSEGAGGYYPVNTENSLIYDGLRHSITGIPVSENYTDPAGLFGITKSGSKVKNLELIDFSIHSKEADAGALIGYADNTKIYNIIAYNKDIYKNDNNNKLKKPTITGKGAVGGLVGEMQGGTMKYCGAALVVSGDDSAGGLIGTTVSKQETTVNDNGTQSTTVMPATILSSYSGGHTDKACYYEDGEKESPLWNIKSQNGFAGGLIGNASGVSIKDSYSTCSAYGHSAEQTGGFVGRASGKIIHCYSTGLVSGDEADNAFIGNDENAEISNSFFFEIVNEYKGTSGMEYKGAGNDNVTALDAAFADDDKIYESFVKGKSTWNEAKPYDDTVAAYYQNKYNLMTVTQLDSTSKTRNETKSKNITSKDTLYVDKHYGDWPAPELFIIN